MKTIFFGGKVYTGQLPVVEAFVIDGDHFVFAGTSAQALVLAEKHDRLVDLDGKFVCAGFNDTHMHLLNFGQTLKIAPLHEHTGSLAPLIPKRFRTKLFTTAAWPHALTAMTGCVVETRSRSQRLGILLQSQNRS